MKIRTFLIASLLMFVFVGGYGQSNALDTSDVTITSVHTEDQDTLYFSKGEFGQIFKEAWMKGRRIGSIKEVPEIILLSYSELKKLAVRRGDLVTNYVRKKDVENGAK